MKEIWKDIPGYEGKFQASNLGRLKNSKRLLVCNKVSSKGYIRHRINKLTCFAHRLIAITFISNPQAKKQVNHKNGIKTDNRVENLEWVTNQENRNHAKENNLIATRATGLGMLSNQDVKNIINMYESGEYKQKYIANKYRISQQHVSRLWNKYSSSGRSGL